jgi:hypothetical protein
MNLYEGERGLLSYFLFGLRVAVVERRTDTMRRG